MSPRLRPSPESLLARALELLSVMPLEALDETTRHRLRTLLDDAGAKREHSEAATVSERPRLYPVHLAAGERLLLERALRSAHVGPHCNHLVRDFLLACAKQEPFERVPDLARVVVPPGFQSTVLAFSEAELDAVRSRAAAIGCDLDAFMKGCAFAFLSQLQARWPDDPELAAAAPPAPVPIHFFKQKR